MTGRGDSKRQGWEGAAPCVSRMLFCSFGTSPETSGCAVLSQTRALAPGSPVQAGEQVRGALAVQTVAPRGPPSQAWVVGGHRPRGCPRRQGRQGQALLSETPRRTCAGMSEGQCGGQCDFRGVGKAEGGGGRAHKAGRGREQGQGHMGGVQFRRWTQGGSNVLLPAPWGLWWAWHPRMSDVAGAGKPAHARTNVLLSGGL